MKDALTALQARLAEFGTVAERVTMPATPKGHGTVTHKNGDEYITHRWYQDHRGVHLMWGHYGLTRAEAREDHLDRE